MSTSNYELIDHARLCIIIELLYFVNRVGPSVLRRIYKTKPRGYLNASVCKIKNLYTVKAAIMGMVLRYPSSWTKKPGTDW